jgi:ATP-citrate lyase beta-subunit
MARVKLSEYRAKKILLGDGYRGVQLRSGEKMSIPAGEWVAKVDQGVKKRMKQGLVLVGKPAADIRKAIAQWEKKGFSQFLLEPLLPHEAAEEQYLSLERVRDGIRILHAKDGGIDIESHPEKVYTAVHTSPKDSATVARATALPKRFIEALIRAFDGNHFAFLEINPLVVRKDGVFLLDAAVLVDSAAGFFVRSWGEDDIVRARSKHPAETRVEELAATTAASLRLSVIDPDGALFFLLSGGGGSIVIADEAQLDGAGDLIANYGEYSGGPTREETYLYAREVIDLMLASKAAKKALVIAGGVANFTDVRSTFLGIIDALTERAAEMRKAQIKVFVRRGGPNEAAGLALMKDFLVKQGLYGSVHGSDAVITTAVSEAIRAII